MVLIISSNDDYSTAEVIRWLIKFKIDFLRINDDSEVEITELTKNNFKFNHNSESYSLSHFDSVWYRRGIINFTFSNELEYLKHENREIQNYIFKLFRDKRHVNNYLNSTVNKLFVLSYKEFKHVNLPEFCVTQSKRVALGFFKKHRGQVISKPVCSSFKVIEQNSILLAYTSKLSLQNIESVNDKFVPTFFQKYEEKKFEIRAFYLHGAFYSMCIFSQKNKKTKVDFRNYDNDVPNRISPFKLPEKIENDLSRMLNYFKLNCASLDIIYNKNGYHLLDVNPVGQFGMVSYPCNYSLEKKIAEYLIAE